jgi:hypothetical protein
MNPLPMLPSLALMDFGRHMLWAVVLVWALLGLRQAFWRSSRRAATLIQLDDRRAVFADDLALAWRFKRIASAGSALAASCGRRARLAAAAGHAWPHPWGVASVHLCHGFCGLVAVDALGRWRSVVGAQSEINCYFFDSRLRTIHADQAAKWQYFRRCNRPLALASDPRRAGAAAVSAQGEVATPCAAAIAAGTKDWPA